MMKWVPSFLTLSFKGKSKPATLEFRPPGGFDSGISCDRHVFIAGGGHYTKRGIKFFTYVFTAEEAGPYTCTWQAIKWITGSQELTSTLTLTVKP